MTEARQRGERRTAEGSRRDPVVTAITAGVGLLLSLQAIIFLVHSWGCITFPYQLDYGEGPILQIALRVAAGKELYPDLTGYPYVIASYMPGYYLLSALAARITGPSFAGGRFISFLGAITIALCVGMVVWERTRHRFASFAAGALILAIPHFLVWSTLMRVDIPALAFGVAGFCLFTRGRITAGIVLFALAVFTRRTAVAPMAAALLWLAWRSGWRAALKAAVVQALVIAVLVGAALLVTRGGLYRQLSWHTATSLGGSWTWQQVGVILSIAVRHWPVYLLLSGVGGVWCLARPRHRVLVVYLAIACGMALTMGRIGSSHNYLLEPLAAGAMVFGVAWAELAGPVRPRRIALLVLGGLLAGQMLATDHRLSYNISLLRPRVSLAAGREVVSRLAEAPGMVLCEDVGLIELAGKEAPIEPFEFTQLARAGVVESAGVVEDLHRGRFSLVVLRCDAAEVRAGDPGVQWVFDRWLESALAEIRSEYRLDRRTGPYWLYVPRGDLETE